MASGAVLSNWSSAQELPGGVATDLFEQAMQEELTVPDAAPEATRTEVEVATVRRPKRPSKPKEVLKLPPHVVAFLQKTAAKRAAAAADQAPAGSSLTGGLDVIVPRYDPSRADD